MIAMAVHATTAKQSDQVQLLALIQNGLRGVKDSRDLRQRPIGDCVGDARDILVDDAPGAQIEMAYFELPICPGHQADMHPRRMYNRAFASLAPAIKVRRARLRDRVAIFSFAYPPAVQYDQHHWFSSHQLHPLHHVLAIGTLITQICCAQNKRFANGSVASGGCQHGEGARRNWRRCVNQPYGVVRFVVCPAELGGQFAQQLYGKVVVQAE